MDIIQSFYYSSNKERQQELEYSLFQNLKKKFINNIHLFIEEKDYEIFCNSNFGKNENYNKIKLIQLNHQPTYPELFDYCCNIDNTICCICNSDIEFEIDNDKILSNLYNEKEIYFISRHEYDMSCPQITKYQGSHDAFIFHSNTLKLNIENKYMKFINYIQNTSGIEALLTIFFIEQLNYKIFNPCLQVKLIHHHKSNIRLWLSTTNHKLPVGYSSSYPNIRQHGIHCKYMIYPCKL